MRLRYYYRRTLAFSPFMAVAWFAYGWHLGMYHL